MVAGQLKRGISQCTHCEKYANIWAWFVCLLNSLKWDNL